MNSQKYFFSAMMLAGMATMLVGSPLIELDFTRNMANVEINAKGHFSGPLPQNCQVDFPYWNASTVMSLYRSDMQGGFLHFTVSNDKTIMLSFPPALFTVPTTNIATGYYKLILTARLPQGMNLRIRQKKAPYTTFWNTELAPNNDWKTYEFFFNIAEQQTEFLRTMITSDTSELKLFFSLHDGLSELRLLTLSSATDAETELIQAREKAEAESRRHAELEKQKTLIRPPQESKNFFRNTRFPLGLPSGFCYDRSVDKVDISSDVGDLGPSGYFALKINNIKVCSEPFNTPSYGSTRKGIISFAYKAEHQGKIALIAADMEQKSIYHAIRTIASQTVAATAGWQTIQLEFTEPDAKAQCLYLEFDFPGVLKIDSLQAYYGVPGRTFQPAEASEIALVAIPSRLSAERIQFADEPAMIRYCVIGDHRDAMLKIKVYDHYGNVRELPSIDLMAHSAGEISFSSDKSTLGQFRLEAWVERSGKRISPWQELIITRIRTPHYWRQYASDSPFGAVFKPQKAPTLKAAGINWARLHDDGGMDYIAWSKLEPERGKWRFQDNKIALYREAYMNLIGQLYTVPQWASHFDGISRNSYFDQFCQPRDLADYANYVKTVTSRYKGIIQEYIIWNEPTWSGTGNDSFYWHKNYNSATKEVNPNPNSVKEFIDLSRVAYQTAKAVDPSLRIVGINAGFANWVEKMHVGGAYDYCDLADFHLYSAELFGYPGDSLDRLSAEALKTARLHGKQLINSECNGSRFEPIPNQNDGTGIYRHSIVWQSPADPLDIADRQCRFVMKQLAMGIKQVILYSESCNFTLAHKPNYATLLGADGFPTPTFAAFSNLAWFLEDREPIACISVGKNVWAYVFSGKNSSLAVISGLKQNYDYTSPAADSLSAYDLFGNRLPPSSRYCGRLLYLHSPLPATEMVKRLKTNDIATPSDDK